MPFIGGTFEPVASSAPVALIPMDSFRPDAITTPNPIAFGHVEESGLALGTMGVLVPRKGLEGVVALYNDRSMSNGIPNYLELGQGAYANYDTHYSAAVVASGGKLTSAGLQFPGCMGGDVAYQGTRGTSWTYTKTGYLFVLWHGRYSNGSHVLVAVDGDPKLANGVGLKRVTAAQCASGQPFDTAIISSLPAPWSTLPSLEGCPYYSCQSATLGCRCQEIFRGAEGSHTIKLAVTATGGGSRDYLCAMGYVSTADGPVASGYAPPAPNVNATGRAIAYTHRAYYFGLGNNLSMNEGLELASINGSAEYFNGGNHPDGASVSQESASSGRYLTVGTLSAASVTVSGCADTTGIAGGDKLVIRAPYATVLATVAASPNVTATSFDLTAAPGVSTGGPCRIDRADWTVSVGATSASQTLAPSGIMPSVGDALTFYSPSGFGGGTVIAIAGAVVTLDQPVTTAAGAYVVRLGCAESYGLLFDGATPLLLRAGEVRLGSGPTIVSQVRATRSHPSLGTTMSAAAARGDSTITVASVSGLAVNQMIGLFSPSASGPICRHVATITGISGNSLTLSSPLAIAAASGLRVTPGMRVTTVRTLATGGAYSLFIRQVFDRYLPGWAASTFYSSMVTAASVESGYTTAFTYDAAGLETMRPYTYPSSLVTTADFPCAAARFVNATGRELVWRDYTGDSYVRLEERPVATDGVMKLYCKTRGYFALPSRTPRTAIVTSFALDVRFS